VTTAVDEDTLGYTDKEHLRYAADRNWTVLTFDDDFLSLVQTELDTLDHGGIIYAPQHGQTIGDLVKRIDSTLQQYRDQDLVNRIVYA